MNYNLLVTHARLIKSAERWLRRHGCRVVLSEQTADSGEVPDVIGWTCDGHSIVIECKVSRADFLVDSRKLARKCPDLGMGCERYYLAPKHLIKPEQLPPGWGLLEHSKGEIEMVLRASSHSQRASRGMLAEMKLLLASLRRVEVRIEPQTITDFLKWKNRMAEYNGGRLPEGLAYVDEKMTSLP